ncbi:MAG TPA: RNA polymerase sigma factor SigM [Mycobacteriales bacterium]|nr:RNA polymerase sigma factor SigM [Mycobacteriales bacterium]
MEAEGSAAAGGEDARDRALLAAHVAGDGESFGTLVGLHRDRLWAVALRTLGDREEAADAVQDALLSAYRSAGSYRGDAKVTTWLHRVVVNACLDRMRRARVRPTVPFPATGASEPVDPHDRLGDRETVMELESALATLPAEQRLAVLLVDVHGLPVEEAARVLEVPAGTVKSRCSRGRARLAVQLGHLRNPTAVAPVRSVPGNDDEPGSTPEKEVSHEE